MVSLLRVVFSTSSQERNTRAWRETAASTRAWRETGASSVEFAVILSVLLLLLTGTIQFGIAFHRKQGLEAAAREGARLASVGGTYEEILDRVLAALNVDEQSGVSDKSDVKVNTDPSSKGSERPCAKAGVGSLVRVGITVPKNPQYAIVIPLWGDIQIDYNAAGKFRCEKAS